MNYDSIHFEHRNALVLQHKEFLADKAFLEFGVYKGTSMLMWQDVFKQNGLPCRFTGFDSFKGLPPEKEDKNTIWRESDFSTFGNINPALLQDDIQLVVGFYDQSLNAATAAKFYKHSIGLVHVDCDTYSSTKTVWEWLLQYELLAKGALIVYDDWGAWLQAKCGEYEVAEAKAHKEIEAKYNLHFTDLGKYVVDPNFYEVKVYKCN